MGSKELELVEASGFTAFPPRLPEQPIFYPVTNESYAAQIARSWNTKEGDRLGFVAKFAVDSEFLQQFDRKIVGSKTHEEYWVPAEKLDAFNAALVGQIEIIARFTEEDRLRQEEKNDA
jgi:hypothetical protein